MSISFDGGSLNKVVEKMLLLLLLKFVCAGSEKLTHAYSANGLAQCYHRKACLQSRVSGPELFPFEKQFPRLHRSRTQERQRERKAHGTE